MVASRLPPILSTILRYSHIFALKTIPEIWKYKKWAGRLNKIYFCLRSNEHCLALWMRNKVVHEMNINRTRFHIFLNVNMWILESIRRFVYIIWFSLQFFCLILQNYHMLNRLFVCLYMNRWKLGRPHAHVAIDAHITFIQFSCVCLCKFSHSQFQCGCASDSVPYFRLNAASFSLRSRWRMA